MDFSSLTNKYVKVIVQQKNNAYLFDLFVDKIQEASAFDIKIVEDTSELSQLDEQQLIDEAQDTQTILNQYIDNVETRLNKKSIKRTVSELYNEAINL